MQKIISLYQRNYDGDRLVRDEIVPGAEWVVAGEGVATRKWDGTAVLVRGGELYARFDAKRGKTPPAGWEPAQEPDPVTGHWPGWLRATRPEDRWIREAWANSGVGSGVLPAFRPVADGTYEAVGPAINSNHEGFDSHRLIRHGALTLPEPMHPRDVPRDFEGLRAYFEAVPIEGIVWHHPDGRMVKIKARDFGIAWPR